MLSSFEQTVAATAASDLETVQPIGSDLTSDHVHVQIMNLCKQKVGGAGVGV
jgi:hypothetical protein